MFNPYPTRKVFCIQSWMVSYTLVHELFLLICLFISTTCIHILLYCYYTHGPIHAHIVKERSNDDISRHYSVTMLLKGATVSIFYATFFCLKCPFEMPPSYLFKLPFIFLLFLVLQWIAWVTGVLNYGGYVQSSIHIFIPSWTGAIHELALKENKLHVWSV